MRLYRRSRQVEAFGYLLDGEVCRKEREDPKLGGSEVKISSTSDAVLELVEPRREGSGVRISAQCGPCVHGMFVCGQALAEVEAEVAPAELEIGVEPAGSRAR